MPDERPVEWWIVDGTLSAEPVKDAETVFDGGWILPGLVDAHCHVGLGQEGAIELDEAVAQAETERGVGALLLRDAGSPTDTRSLDDRDDLPRIIRARSSSRQAEAVSARVRHRAGRRVAAARRVGRASAVG